MKLLLKLAFLVFSLAFIIYLILPNPEFPPPPPGVNISGEPADIETPLRRAFYTDLSREEVMSYYQNIFRGYRLNYPPEEAQTLIRDQTKSTFLEEIVHPFRESLFISGFEPSDPQFALIKEGKLWRQKIILRYVPSFLVMRVVLAALTLFFLFFVVKEFCASFLEFIGSLRKFKLWSSQ